MSKMTNTDFFNYEKLDIILKHSTLKKTKLTKPFASLYHLCSFFLFVFYLLKSSESVVKYNKIIATNDGE